MRTIYKYEADDDGFYVVPQHDARVVLVAQQFTDRVFPTLWVEVDTDRPTNERSRFQVHGTGHPVDWGQEHVGSAVVGSFVWHVYRAAEDTNS